MSLESRKIKPDWLKVKLITTPNYSDMKNLMSKHTLNTVCEEARCPNIYECWDNRTATVMILGDTCTRSCGFCSVKTGKPDNVDSNEPKRVANLVEKLSLRHVVVTSVDRDDLKDDYGSQIWHDTVIAIKEKNPDCTIEILTPDFRGFKASLDKDWFALYQRYIEARHRSGSMYPADRNDFLSFIGSEWMHTEFMHVYQNEELELIHVDDLQVRHPTSHHKLHC